LSVEAVHDTEIAVAAEAVVRSCVGEVGGDSAGGGDEMGAVAAQGAVLAVTVATCERLPALSNASTPNTAVIPQLSAVNVWVISVVFATRTRSRYRP
jgi:hypothetical protein